jgi:ribonuclease P/MRP protein subunit POP1
MNAMSKSTIFDRNVIDELNKEKKSTFELNKIRSNYLLPSTELKTLENHSKVPVLIIQNAVHNGNHKIFNGNLFTGWDIVLPNGWAMAFWMCLVHLGARAIGQNELNYLLFESG